MPKPSPIKHSLLDEKSRGLISRVIRENFGLYKWKYALAIVLMLITSAATAGTAFLLRDVVKCLFEPSQSVSSASAPAKNSNFASKLLSDVAEYISGFFLNHSAGMVPVIVLSLSIILLFAIKGLSQYGSSIILSRVGNNIVARTQKQICSHIQKQSMRFFVNHPSSELITIVTVGANSTNTVMSMLISRLQDVFMSIALVIAMINLNATFSLFFLFIIGPMILGLNHIISRVKKLMKQQQKGMVQVVSALQEGVLGIKLVKSFNLEEKMMGRYNQAIQDVEMRANKITRLSERTSPMMESLGGFVIAIIVMWSGYKLVTTGQSAKDLIGFLTALLLAYEPVKRIAKSNVSLNQALMGVTWMFSILDEDDRIIDSPNAVDLQVSSGSIRLEHVDFAYHEGQNVLHDVSLNCPGSQVTALVGPSGSGKSTTLHLIEKFFIPQKGRILIDDQDLRDLKEISLRENVALVSQDTFLFNDSVYNNILFGRTSATEAEVHEAARSAYADEFIKQLPNGYHTTVGENGSQLSGGQRQRISIARAFLKNAPILLLDEATSALDSESEKQIQAAFDTLMEGRTTIVIAHRFSTIRNAKMIHVFDQGRIVASGTHETLMQDQEGLYTYLYKLQFQETPHP